MTDDAGTTLLFPDRRSRGRRYPVTDARGTAVAQITAGWSMTRFTVADPAGRPLASAATGWSGFSRTWRAALADGSPLLTLTARMFRAGATAELADGTVLTVRGSAWRRDFTVTAADGTPVLVASPRTSAVSLRPYDYAVSQPRPVLSLPTVVVLVQVWRTVRKAEGAAAGAGAATAAVASSG
jgi:hypothetical protein